MIQIIKLDPSRKAHIRRFITQPFEIYATDSNWVPPLRLDIAAQMDKSRFPFYEHSEADFFLAQQNGKDVGRIAIIHNRPYNQHHQTRRAQFYHFESQPDPEIAAALFSAAADWATTRGLNEIIGPKGLSALDGYGLLVEGFDQRTMMTMMIHNPPSYPMMLENLGFTKEVDFISCYVNIEDFHFPARIHQIADRVRKRGILRVHDFSTTRELKAWAGRIGEAYNRAFVHNWEYYPLSQREIAMVVNTLETIADPRLIKIITHEEQVVGFLFAFPDSAAALQRNQGKLFPFGLPDLLLEMRRTPWVAVNAAGILPEFQGQGGNALLYSEMERTVRSRHFKFAALYQVAETAVQMRHDLASLGGIRYKNHRVYRLPL